MGHSFSAAGLAPDEISSGDPIPDNPGAPSSAPVPNAFARTKNTRTREQAPPRQGPPSFIPNLSQVPNQQFRDANAGAVRQEIRQQTYEQRLAYQQQKDAEKQASDAAKAQQKSIEDAAAADAKTALHDENNVKEAAWKTAGIKTYTDANGRIQKLTDPLTGRDQRADVKGETQWDATGKAFRMNLKDGKMTQESPDAKAKLVANPNSKTDRNLYRENSQSPWDAVTPEQALLGDDPAEKSIAAEHLRGLEAKRLKNERALLEADIPTDIPSSGKERDALRATEDTPDLDPLTRERKASVTKHDDIMKRLQANKKAQALLDIKTTDEFANEQIKGMGPEKAAKIKGEASQARLANLAKIEAAHSAELEKLKGEQARLAKIEDGAIDPANRPSHAAAVASLNAKIEAWQARNEKLQGVIEKEHAASKAPGPLSSTPATFATPEQANAAADQLAKDPAALATKAQEVAAADKKLAADQEAFVKERDARMATSGTAAEQIATNLWQRDKVEALKAQEATIRQQKDLIDHSTKRAKEPMRKEMEANPLTKGVAPHLDAIEQETMAQLQGVTGPEAEAIRNEGIRRQNEVIQAVQEKPAKLDALMQAWEAPYTLARRHQAAEEIANPRSRKQARDTVRSDEEHRKREEEYHSTDISGKPVVRTSAEDLAKTFRDRKSNSWSDATPSPEDRAAIAKELGVDPKDADKLIEDYQKSKFSGPYAKFIANTLSTGKIVVNPVNIWDNEILGKGISAEAVDNKAKDQAWADVQAVRADPGIQKSMGNMLRNSFPLAWDRYLEKHGDLTPAQAIEGFRRQEDIDGDKWSNLFTGKWGSISLGMVDKSLIGAAAGLEGMTQMTMGIGGMLGSSTMQQAGEELQQDAEFTNAMYGQNSLQSQVTKMGVEMLPLMMLNPAIAAAGRYATIGTAAARTARLGVMESVTAAGARGLSAEAFAAKMVTQGMEKGLAARIATAYQTQNLKALTKLATTAGEVQGMTQAAKVAIFATSAAQSAGYMQLEAGDAYQKQEFTRLLGGRDPSTFSDGELEDMHASATSWAMKKARPLAAAAGVVTGLLTTVLPKGDQYLQRWAMGLPSRGATVTVGEMAEKMGMKQFEKMLKSGGMKTGIGTFFKHLGVGIGDEFLEEMPDQLFQGALAAWTYNPDKKWADVVIEALDAGGMGALMGGAGGALEGKHAAASLKSNKAESVKALAALTPKNAVVSAIHAASPSDVIAKGMEGHADGAPDFAAVDAKIAAAQRAVSIAAGPVNQAWAHEQLAAANEERLKMLHTLAGSQDVPTLQQFADANTELSNAQNPQDAAVVAAALKLHQYAGANMDAADLTALGLEKGPDGKLTSKVPGPDGNHRVQFTAEGKAIFTQTFLNSIRTQFPAVAAVMPKSEQAQRVLKDRSAVPGLPPESKPANSGQKPATKPVPLGRPVPQSPAEQAAAPTSASASTQQTEWDVTVEGQANPIRVTAPTEADAVRQVAEMGKGMVSDVVQVEPPQVSPNGAQGDPGTQGSPVPLSERPGAGLPGHETKADSTPVPALGMTVGQIVQTLNDETHKLANAAGGKASQAQLDANRAMAVHLAKALEKWQKVFPQVTIGPVDGGAGLYVDKGKLGIDFSRLAASASAFKEHSGKWADLAIQEEVIHAVGIMLEKAGKWDAAALFKSLPDSVKAQVMAAYPAAETDYLRGHEFMRMLLQNRLNKGTMTELAAGGKGFVEEIQKALKALLDFFRDIAKSLRAEGAAPPTIALVNDVADSIEAMMKELDGDNKSPETPAGKTGGNTTTTTTDGQQTKEEDRKRQERDVELLDPKAPAAGDQPLAAQRPSIKSNRGLAVAAGKGLQGQVKWKPNHVAIGVISFPNYEPMGVEQFPYDGTKEGAQKLAMELRAQASANGASHSATMTQASDETGAVKWVISPNGRIDDVNTPDGQFALGDGNAYTKDRAKRSAAARKRGDTKESDALVVEEITNLVGRHEKNNEYQTGDEIMEARALEKEGESHKTVDNRFRSWDAIIGNMTSNLDYRKQNASSDVQKAIALLPGIADPAVKAEQQARIDQVMDRLNAGSDLVTAADKGPPATLKDVATPLKPGEVITVRMHGEGKPGGDARFLRAYDGGFKGGPRAIVNYYGGLRTVYLSDVFDAEGKTIEGGPSLLHAQAPGENLDERVVASTSVSALTGAPGYKDAKYNGDASAALGLVDRFLKKETLADLAKFRGKKPWLVPVVAKEGASLNVIPLAFAEELATRLGGNVWPLLVKTSDFHNTGASAIDRAKNIHKWGGKVPPKGRPIILVDDTWTTGSTLLSLRDRIGRSDAMVTLASGRYGKRITPTAEQVDMVSEKSQIPSSELRSKYSHLTGSQFHQYILNGTRGRDGFTGRYAPAGSGETTEGNQESSGGKTAAKTLKDGLRAQAPTVDYARHAELEARKDSLTPAETAEAQKIVDAAGERFLNQTHQRRGYGSDQALPRERYSGVYYHFTKDKTWTVPRMEDDIGIHVGGIDAARARKAHIEEDNGPDSTSNGEMRRLFVKVENPLRWADVHFDSVQDFFDTREVKSKLAREGHSTNLGLTKDQMAAGRKLKTMGEVREYLKTLGYDGVVYYNSIEGNNDTLITFDPSQIKSADPFTGVLLKDRFDTKSPSIIRAQAPVPAFYSQAQKVIESSMPDTLAEYVATPAVAGREIPAKTIRDGQGKVIKEIPARKEADKPARVMSVKEQLQDILNSGGVKEDELKWSGVLPWVEAQKGPVTKAAVLKYLKTDGSVKFEEVNRMEGKGVWSVTTSDYRIHTFENKEDAEKFIKDERERVATEAFRYSIDVEEGTAEVLNYNNTQPLYTFERDWDGKWYESTSESDEDKYSDTDEGMVDALKERQEYEREVHRVETTRLPVRQPGAALRPPGGDMNGWSVEQVGPEQWAIINPQGEHVDDAYTEEQARSAAIDFGGGAVVSGEAPLAPKFAKYQLPGGENYREVVLAMPVDTTGEPSLIRFPDDESVEDFLTDMSMDGYEGMEYGRLNDGLDVEIDQAIPLAVKRLIKRNGGTFIGGEQKDKAPTYLSTHFPNVGNYIAHMRLNERTDSEGKPGLFVEEFQSDRHQEGREKGYAIPRDTRPTQAQAKEFFGIGDKDWSVLDDAARESFVDEIMENEPHVRGGIPDAPFRTSWPLQLFKRALRDAVAGGKSWIGWTSGETQASRYDLSKQVEKIAVHERTDRGSGEKTRSVFIQVPVGDGSITLRVNNEGVVVDADAASRSFMGKSLDDVVGKEMAEKIMAAESGTVFSGQDLKIGGKGMKKFYDGIVTAEVSKYVKQWGGTVERGRIKDMEQLKRYVSSYSAWLEYVDPDGVTSRDEFYAMSEAERLSFVPDDGKTKSTPFWKVEINPVMARSIKESGQALYAQAPTEDEDQATVGNRHILKVGRNERVVGDSEHLTPKEVASMTAAGLKRFAILKKAAKGEKKKLAELNAEGPEAHAEAFVQRLRGIIEAHPASDGWADLKFTGIDPKGEPKFQTVKYGFDRVGKKALEQGTPAWDARVDALGTMMAEEIRKLYDRATSGDEAAKNIISQASWYREMRTRLRREFGGLGDLFADQLGATSPNTPVRDNWANAIDILRRATKGDWDHLMPQWEQWAADLAAGEAEMEAWFAAEVAKGRTKANIKDEGGLDKWENKQVPKGASKAKRKAILKRVRSTPEGKERIAAKAAEEYQVRIKALAKLRELPEHLIPVKEGKDAKKYGFNGKNAVRALLGMWRVIKAENADIGRGASAPKALNFSGNLIGFRQGATIDVWAARLLQRLAGFLRIPSVAEGGVDGTMLPSGETAGQFRFGQDAFADAVAKIRADSTMATDEKLRDVNPDDLQAIVWFLEKEYWTLNNWTSAAGEGGSFEFEADLAGAERTAEIRELRRIIDSTKSTTEQVKAAMATLNGMTREVDHWHAGVSVEQSVENQGAAYVPTDAHMELVQNAIKRAIYEDNPKGAVVASKVFPTEGRFGSSVERSFDVEISGREDFRPDNVWLEILRQGQQNKQKAVYLARKLRAGEVHDPAFHRPGVEVYFKNSLKTKEEVDALTKTLTDFGIAYMTMVTDPRPSASARAGEMPPVLGVRFLHLPEFDADYGDESLVGKGDEEVAAAVTEKADAMAELANSILSEIDNANFANRFWYETDSAFTHEYTARLNEGMVPDHQSPGLHEATRRKTWRGRSGREAISGATARNGTPAGESERRGPLPESSAVPRRDARSVDEAGTLRAQAPVPAFYSQAERAIEASMPDTLSEYTATPAVPGREIPAKTIRDASGKVIKEIPARKEADKPARVVSVKEQLQDVLKSGAVKEDELKWSGLIPWVESQKGPVTKEAVLNYLRTDGAAKFEEVVGGKQDAGARSMARLNDVALEKFGQYYGDLSDQDASAVEAEVPLETFTSPTKFAKYQLHGGENYREVVLAMPKKASVTLKGDPIKIEVKDSDNFPEEDYGKEGDYVLRYPIGVEILRLKNGDYYVILERDEYQSPYLDEVEGPLMAWAESEGILPNSGNYTSNHFPAVPNYVAHMRLNERADADGKPGLFMEELQSDRHQKGREVGYNTPATIHTFNVGGISGLKAEFSSFMDGWEITIPGGEPNVRRALASTYKEGKKHVARIVLGPGRVTIVGKFKSAEEAKNAILESNLYGHDSNDVENGNFTDLYTNKEEASDGADASKVPDAPFRTTWPLQLFKRALRDAVASGKSWVGWTSGATQADRYDLSKQVDKVQWDKEKKRLWAYKNGPSVINQEGVSESNLADYIGKEAAQKMIEMPDRVVTQGQEHYNLRELSGNDLKVGGAGMKKFYDGIMPSEVAKYVKQWGGTVERSKLLNSAKPMNPMALTGPEATWPDQLAGNSPIWRVKITPAMRKSVSEEGQALYAQAPVAALYSQAQRVVESSMPDTLAEYVATPAVPGRDIPAKTIRDGQGKVIKEIPARKEADKPARVMTVKEQLQDILKAGGVKEDELKWSGVLPWAEAQAGPVTKAAVLEYLRTDGSVKFEEVTAGYGGNPSNPFIKVSDDLWKHSVPDARGGEYTLQIVRSGSRFTVESVAGERVGEKNDLEAAMRLANEHVDNDSDVRNTSVTKYGRYQLPGGENYREVVLAMPDNKDSRLEQVAQAEMGKSFSLLDDDLQQVVRERAEKSYPDYGGNYTSSHFPAVPNYVAHMRLNERADTEGNPGLFMEELQSDRHQAGREKGYSEKPSTEGWTATYLGSPMGNPIYRIYNASGEQMSDERGISPEAAIEAAAVADERFSRTFEKKVPDAPFRSTWPLQLFKRALRDAVASGKAWVGWTDGNTQADRYDLSKQIDELQFRTQDGGETYILAAVKDDNYLHVFPSGDPIPKTKLADYVGKSVAEKIIEGGETGSISGDGLKVGGHGMKKFYDGILTSEVAKYVKQWGGEVKLSKVGAPKKGTGKLTREEISEATSDAKLLLMGDVSVDEFNDTWGTYLTDDDIPGDDPSRRRDHVRGLLDTVKSVRALEAGGIFPAWKVDITPEMQKTVSEVGQALYAQAPTVDFARHAELESRKDSLTDAEKAEADTLVAAAAKAARYRIGRVFHGSKGNPEVFDKGFADREDNWSFSDKRSVADSYRAIEIDASKVWEAYKNSEGREREQLDRAFYDYANENGEINRESIDEYVRQGNEDQPLLWVEPIHKITGIPRSDFHSEQSPGAMVTAYLRMDNPIHRYFEGTADVQREVRPDGTPDGYIDHNVMDTETGAYSQLSTVYHVNESSQIKSAERFTGTRLEDRFDQESDSILRTQAPDEGGRSFSDLLADAGVDTKELDKAFADAAAELPGLRSTGNPSRSLGGGVNSPSDPVIFGTDHYYDATLTAQTHEMLRERARTLLEEDYEGWVQYFVSYSLASGGQGLAGHEAMAAQMAVERESRLPLTPERKRRLQALVWAYRLSGTEAARTLSARRDPFKSPVERNREFLAKAIFEPSPALAKRIEAAETPEKKQALLALDAQRIAKVQKAFAKMGITLDEVLNGDVKLGLIKSDVALAAMASLPETDRKAAEMAQDGQKSFKEIADATGMSPEAVKAVKAAAVANIKADLRRRAMMAAKSETLSAQSPEQDAIDFAALGAMTEEEREAEIDRLVQQMGFFPDAQQGKRKTVTRRKAKLFVPPSTPGRRNPGTPRTGNAPPTNRTAPAAPQTGGNWNAGPTEVSVLAGSDLANAEDTLKMFRASQAINGSPLDMVKEAWVNFVLSGPATQWANVLGNTASGAWEFTFQRGMEAMWNLVARDQKGATFGEMAHIMKALLPGLSRGFKLMAKAWRTENDFFKEDVLGEREVIGPKGEKQHIAIGGTTGRVVRVPGRALMAMDGFYKGLFGQMEAAAQGYRIAKSEGLKGDALQRRITGLLNTKGSPAWQIAVTKAQELTFQEKLPESMMVFQQLVNSTKIGSFLFPFVKTPYNIFRAGIRKSPLGSLNLAWHIGKHGLAKISAEGKIEPATSAQMVRWLAEQTFAWMGMALLWGAAGGDDDDDKKYFLITGAPPRDRGEKALMERSVGGGFQIKIGDFTMNYGRIEPLATILGTMMDGIRAIKSGATSGAAAASILDNIKGQVMNKTFLAGLAAIIDGIERPGKWDEKAKSAFLSALVPNLIRQPLRNTDEVVRDASTAEWWYPAWPSADNGGSPIVDPATGVDKTKGGSDLSRLVQAPVSPRMELSSADRTLLKYNRENPSKSWAPAVPPRLITFSSKQGNKPAVKVELNKEAYHYLQVRSATLARNMLRGRVFAADDAGIDAIRKVYSDARDQAREELTRRPIEKIGTVK